MVKFSAVLTLSKRFSFLTGDTITAEEATAALADFASNNGADILASNFDGTDKVYVEFAKRETATQNSSFFGSLVGNANAAFPLIVAVTAGFAIVGLAAVSWTVSEVKELVISTGEVVNSGSGKLITFAIVGFALSSLIGTFWRNS